MIVLLVVEFGLALTLFITSSSLRRHFSQTMIEHGIDTYRQESYEDFTSFIDWLQIEVTKKKQSRLHFILFKYIT